MGGGVDPTHQGQGGEPFPGRFSPDSREAEGALRLAIIPELDFKGDFLLSSYAIDTFIGLL